MLNLEDPKEGREKKFKEAIDLLILKSLKKVNIETFKKTLSDKLSKLESNSNRGFEKAFLIVVNKQAPLKTKFLSHQNNLFMTKELRKQL